MDCNVGISTGGSQKGTVTSDGSTYQIWQHQQTNQPSIQGTSTFQQYISINSACKTSGTISVENHFKAWSGLGMSLGTLNFQVIAAESWSGSGSANQQVNNNPSSSSSGGGSPSSPPPPPPPSSSSSPPPPPASSGGGDSGGSCAASWGQCGGTGYNGPTCCSGGQTCQNFGDYWSQCQG
jgi:endo-1,4-beta-xylanase